MPSAAATAIAARRRAEARRQARLQHVDLLSHGQIQKHHVPGGLIQAVHDAFSEAGSDDLAFRPMQRNLDGLVQFKFHYRLDPPGPTG